MKNKISDLTDYIHSKIFKLNKLINKSNKDELQEKITRAQNELSKLQEELSKLQNTEPETSSNTSTNQNNNIIQSTSELPVSSRVQTIISSIENKNTTGDIRNLGKINPENKIK
jgi:alanyl-tRNA synthetase